MARRSAPPSPRCCGGRSGSSEDAHRRPRRGRSWRRPHRRDRGGGGRLLVRSRVWPVGPPCRPAARRRRQRHRGPHRGRRRPPGVWYVVGFGLTASSWPSSSGSCRRQRRPRPRGPVQLASTSVETASTTSSRASGSTSRSSWSPRSSCSSGPWSWPSCGCSRAGPARRCGGSPSPTSTSSAASRPSSCCSSSCSGSPSPSVPFFSSLGREDQLFWLAVLALTLIYGAYVAEVYRSGLESIHWSQTAAARSLGPVARRRPCATSSCRRRCGASSRRC